MIETISIKGVASYNVEVTIKELKKVNFFFGNNGSGKSTISKFVFNKGLPDEISNSNFDNCQIQGYNKDIHQLLVFDDQFVERNFINSDTQAGIFSLNEKNEAIDTLIETEQTKLKSDENHLEKVLLKREKNFNKSISDGYVKLKKDSFDERKVFSTFYKHTINHKGNSQKHLLTIEGILKNQPIPIKSIEYLTGQYNKIYEKNILRIETNIPPITYRLIRKKEDDLNKLMREVIVGNNDVDIAKMINEFNSKKWVEEGLNYLNEDSTKQKCPFCQEETITKELLKKFSDYFDQAYKNKIKEITDLKDEYIKLSTRYIELFQKLKNGYNEGNVVSDLIIKLEKHFDDNLKNIIEKIKASNEKKGLNSLKGFKIDIVTLNKKVCEHNSEFDNLDKTKERFDEDIWYYFALKSKDYIDTYYLLKERLEANLNVLDVLKESTKEIILESKGKIENWRTETVSTSDSVDRINEILRNCGFTGFEIEAQEKVNNITKYRLTRSTETGTNVFKTLSEGEKNFIAFLYFYQLCLGTDKVEDGEKKKIILFDDPVSSLDSQVLFVVNTLIHQLIARKGNNPKANKKEFLNPLIEQVLLLTHNIFFFKELALDNNRGCTLRQFYHISKINGTSSIEKKGEKEIVTSDYNLMWNSLKSIKSSVENQNKEHNILIGNIMRRIIESYVNFTGISSSVWGAIKGVNPEDTRNIICSTLISEINDSSHKVSPLDDIYFTRIMNETPDSLFEVFKLIFKEIGKEHYELMMEEEIEEVASLEETEIIEATVQPKDDVEIETEVKAESVILESETQIQDVVENETEPIAESDTPIISTEVLTLIRLIYRTCSQSRLRKDVGIKNDRIFEKEYFTPAMENGIIEEVSKVKKVPQYFLTEKGEELKVRLS